MSSISGTSLGNISVDDPFIHLLKFQCKRIFVCPSNQQLSIRLVWQRFFDHHGCRQTLDKGSIDAHLDSLGVAEDFDRGVKSSDLIDTGLVRDGKIRILKDGTIMVSQ